MMPYPEKLVSLYCFIALSVFNLPSPVSSSQVDTRSTVNNAHGISPQLLFDIKLHGVLLWASIGFLMPVAILVMRMSMNKEQCGKRLRIIFYVHAITQIIAVLLATAAAVMSIKYFDNAFNNDHQRIGLAFYVFMWLQALAGLFRPRRGSKGRTIWFVFHWLMGLTVSLLGIINIYTGLQAYHRRTSKDVRTWTIIFTVEISLIFLAYLLQEKWHYIKKQGLILGNKPVQPTDQEMSPRSQQKHESSEHC